MEDVTSKTWRADLAGVVFTALCAFIFVVFTSCTEGGSTGTTVAEDPIPDPSSDPSNTGTGSSGNGGFPPVNPGTGSGTSTAEIVVWGDSTTSGIGASTPDWSYPAQLQSLTGRTTYNGGVSGQTSDQIAAREGGAPALLTFPNNLLPASGPVVVQAESTFPITAEGPGPITGTVNGFHGTLSYEEIGSTHNPRLVFTRDDIGSVESIPASTPFHPDTFAREAQLNVFWMGQNNFYDPAAVKSDIAKSVAFLSTDKYIVMSLLNAGDEGIGTSSYDQLAQINADLAATYGSHFLDIRKILVNHYDSANPQDVRDYNSDVPPYSLRNDNEHLNDQGYGLVAQQIAAFAAARNW